AEPIEPPVRTMSACPREDWASRIAMTRRAAASSARSCLSWWTTTVGPLLTMCSLLMMPKGFGLLAGLLVVWRLDHGQTSGQGPGVDLVRVEPVQLVGQALGKGAAPEADPADRLARWRQCGDGTVGAQEVDIAAGTGEPDTDHPGSGTGARSGDRAPQCLRKPSRHQVCGGGVACAGHPCCQDRLVGRLVQYGCQEATPQGDAGPREVGVARLVGLCPTPHLRPRTGGLRGIGDPSPRHLPDRRPGHVKGSLAGPPGHYRGVGQKQGC